MNEPLFDYFSHSPSLIRQPLSLLVLSLNHRHHRHCHSPVIIMEIPARSSHMYTYYIRCNRFFSFHFNSIISNDFIHFVLFFFSFCHSLTSSSESYQSFFLSSFRYFLLIFYPNFYLNFSLWFSDAHINAIRVSHFWRFISDSRLIFLNVLWILFFFVLARRWDTCTMNKKKDRIT